MACGLLAWWYIRNSPSEHPSVNAAEADYIAHAHAREDALAPPAGGGGLARLFRLPFRLVHVPGLDVLQCGVLWPLDLDADLSLCGPRARYQAAGRFAVRNVLFRLRRRAGRRPDWRHVARTRAAMPNTIFRTLFGIAAIVATLSIVGVAYVHDALTVVLLLSSTLFFLRWCGMYWAIPSILASRGNSGFLGGCMNFGGNIAGVSVPVMVGFIVQTTGSYFLALIFFAFAGVGLFVCSSLIDYSRKLPV